MFVKNTQKKDIALTSFEGYVFNIPSGVSWIWDKAGQHLLTNVYKVEVTTAKDKFGFDNGHGIPALLSATEKEWQKDGKKLATVSRFKINAKLIPRSRMITVAKQRGVGDSKIMEFLSDPNIDTTTIAETINELPIPEEIRYPQEMTLTSVPATV